MKIYKMNCPNCDGPLEYNPKQPLAFCQFCGAPLYFDDGTKRIEIRETRTYNYNHNYNASTKHEEVYRDESKSDKWIALCSMVIIVAVMIFEYLLTN